MPWCFISERFEGAALWLPPGVGRDEATLGVMLEEAVPAERLESMGALFEAMDTYHPHDDDCWYLPIIGVDPGHQGKGIGGALMKHATALLDERGALGYLESSNPRNVPLYERHGFEEIRLDGIPLVTPMVRERR